jgi:hypothetical protein
MRDWFASEGKRRLAGRFKRVCERARVLTKQFSRLLSKAEEGGLLSERR